MKSYLKKLGFFDLPIVNKNLNGLKARTSMKMTLYNCAHGWLYV